MSATKEQGSFITDQNGMVWTLGKAKASIETEILAGPPHLPDAAKAMVLLDALTAAEAELDALRAQVEQLKADRAAVRRECADRAEAWYTQGVPESSRDEYAVEIAQLRAAIEGKEVQG